MITDRRLISVFHEFRISICFELREKSQVHIEQKKLWLTKFQNRRGKKRKLAMSEDPQLPLKLKFIKSRYRCYKVVKLLYATGNN